jgi:hypothetical protein
MKRPSKDFIGSAIGLIIVIPIMLNRSRTITEKDLIVLPLFFSGAGAIIGTVIARLRPRRS